MQIACMMSNTVVSKQIYPYEKLIFVFSTKIGYIHANIIYVARWHKHATMQRI